MFALLALLALRVSVGWHFYKEGAKKLNSPQGFSSAGFMRQATGPWADHFHSLATEPHEWNELLAVADEHKPLDDAQRANIAKWEKENKDALASEDPPVRPHAAYAKYAERVAEDWKHDLQQLQDGSQATAEAKQQAAKQYQEYRRLLLSYLEENSEDLVKYQHELWRLAELQANPTAADLPYQQQRIAEKKAETGRMVAPWLAQVAELEAGLHNSVGETLASEAGPATLPPPTDRLSTIDSIVPYWHMIVGAGLILGLFSRLAGAGAAFFLLMVLATQPPWAAGAADTYYQVVELAGALVLTAIPTGRFAGLDFFVHSLCSRCCTRK